MHGVWLRLFRRAGRPLAAGLSLLAAAALVLTVEVHAGGRTVSCGSGWDVVAGRAGWRQWWAQDQADPVAGAPLLRTDHCVGAVNARIVAATAFTLLALAIVAVTAFDVARRRRSTTRSGLARQLSALGAVVTVVGTVLTVAGLAGIALLVADPAAPLFQFVSRTTVVLLGLLLLIPAVLLVVLGRGATVIAAELDRDRSRDEAA